MPESVECNSCHGDQDSPAPPAGVDEENLTTDLAVGAHRVHLESGSLGLLVACDDCHVVPSEVLAEGHIDQEPAEVVFSGRALRAGLQPTWERGSATCASTYCHGATLAGGLHQEPQWTRVDGSQKSCGSCHGNPPPTPHPQHADCEHCHPDTVMADGTINVDGARHLNGTLDIGSNACNACHGSGPDGSPPPDLSGHTETTAPGVGAHAVHLAASSWHAQIACSECHLVPASLSDEGHTDTAGPAELTFGELAGKQDAVPEYDFTTFTCSGVYCHGSTLAGGGASPDWTATGQNQAACGTCHGLPPEAPHPASNQCSLCHGKVMTSATEFGSPELHIDGTVQVTAGHPEGWAAPLEHGAAVNGDGINQCTSCHGSDLSGGSAGVSCDQCHPGFKTNCVFCHGGLDSQNGAPPEDVDGSTDASLVTVGAHTAHLAADSGWHQTGECAGCHAVPTDALTPGHVDGGKAEVKWGGLAIVEGAEPVWDGEACSSTYCHGSTLAGGGASPDWTAAGQEQAACGTCHGLPPAAPHPASKLCNVCHSEVMTSATEFSSPELHVDGTVQVTEGHPEGWAAPLEHGAAVNGDGIDQCTTCHGSDLSGGSAGVSCDQCHPGFKTNCVFCHGGLDSQNGAPPEDVDGSTDTSLVTVGAHTAHLAADSGWHQTGECAGCHAVPTDALTPGHVDGGKAEVKWGGLAVAKGAEPVWDGEACSSTYCHGATMSGNGSAPEWTEAGKTEAACGTCHGLPPADPHPAVTECDMCHGEVMESALSFGTPEKHINGNVEAVGLHDDEWASPDKHGALVLDSGISLCQICHGEDLSGGTSTVSCDQCHPGFKTNCTFCHGGLDNQTGAPPWDRHGSTDTSLVSVGAHSAHVAAESDWHMTGKCSDCHKVPTDALSEGHVDGGKAEIMWGGLALADGAEPVWDGDTCSGTYCHGNTLKGGSGYSPKWTAVGQGEAACGTCHGLPVAGGPPPPPWATDCYGCHTCEMNPDGLTFKPEKAFMHINGQLNMKGPCF